jgi:bifunctional non-homologous end joining protein LigD
LSNVIRTTDLKKLPSGKTGFIEPMKALLSEKLPAGPQWIYEVKFDGVRALGIKKGAKVELYSRAAKEMTAKYPKVAEALKTLPVNEVILDGEIVAVDREGRPSFQLLQSYQMAGAKKPPLFFYVFDLINLEGKELTSLPLLQRKAALATLLKDVRGTVRFSADFPAESKKVLYEMEKRGLEGLIAKLKDSKYEPGRRGGAWIKFKWSQQQEFVIGGYTPPKGSRSHFGALLVGYYEDEKLLFAAKVGTGFDNKLLASLYQKFQKLIRQECPFANLPEKPGAGGRGLTLSEMRRCVWLEPELVCQVRFAEWTRDNHLRQPAFLGLRDDKEPDEVVREKAT